MFKNVLIVDDSATARMMIRRCLEIAGVTEADFHEAANGVYATKILADIEIDLVLTDLNMPEMDGEALLKRIRGDDKFARTPVVVITSAGNEAKEALLRKEGATMILSKPISPAIIAKAMTHIQGS
jgi:two-component system chemotaxis response regulator CheY